MADGFQELINLPELKIKPYFAEPLKDCEVCHHLIQLCECNEEKENIEEGIAIDKT